MTKAIAIINPSGLGGAEKRYITLYNYLQKQKTDIFLIINRGLLLLAQDKGLLLEGRNILVVDMSFDSAGNSKTGRRDFTKTKKRLNDLLDSASIQNSSRLNRDKIQNFVGSYSSFVKSWIRWLEFKKKIVPMIRENGIDTVYTVWLAGIWLQPLKKKLHLKFIHSFNDSGYSSISNKILDYYKSEYWIIKKADKVDCLSKRLKIGLMNKIKGLKENKLYVSPCSFLDYSKLYAEEKENVIVFCGRLEKIKNPLLFLKAIKLFNSEIPSEWQVLVIGTGSLETDMMAYIKRNQLDCVKMLGYVSEPERYLRKSRIFVSIQQEDNYPSQALMEAMACENAIIASDVGDTRLLIDQECGELVEINCKSIGESILKMVEKAHGLHVYGKSARKKVMSEHTIERYSTYIRKVIE
jgi:glycosyltransferase involved in cell wall biosynthesis